MVVQVPTVGTRRPTDYVSLHESTYWQWQRQLRTDPFTKKLSRRFLPLNYPNRGHVPGPFWLLNWLSTTQWYAIIKSYILNRSQNDLNFIFAPSELDKALTKLKSNATGVDDIHNAMLTNLSPDNKKYLLQLFNHLYINDCVPELWKRLIVIPLLKAGKPADKAASYRPISLTSCLGKLFDRILTNRLNWYV